MAAKRPRISVVLDEDVLDTLRRLATVEGRSVSKVVGELVSGLEPGLRPVVELGEAFESMTEARRAAVRAAVEAGEPGLVEPMRAALEAFGQVMLEVREAAAGDDSPPLGNTGVK